jgi:DNA-binding NtrC family response regulator
LQFHHWPGNVRELENTMARACALASSSILLPEDIPLASAPGKPQPALAEIIDRLLNAAPTGVNVIDWLAREAAGRAIERHQGEIKHAAIALGIPPARLKELLGK